MTSHTKRRAHGPRRVFNTEVERKAAQRASVLEYYHRNKEKIREKRFPNFNERQEIFKMRKEIRAIAHKCCFAPKDELEALLTTMRDMVSKIEERGGGRV